MTRYLDTKFPEQTRKYLSISLDLHQEPVFEATLHTEKTSMKLSRNAVILLIFTWENVKDLLRNYLVESFRIYMEKNKEFKWKKLL